MVQIFTPSSQFTHAYKSTTSLSCVFNHAALVNNMMRGQHHSSTTAVARGESRLRALSSLQPFRGIKNPLMHVENSKALFVRIQSSTKRVLCYNRLLGANVHGDLKCLLRGLKHELTDLHGEVVTQLEEKNASKRTNLAVVDDNFPLSALSI